VVHFATSVFTDPSLIREIRVDLNALAPANVAPSNEMLWDLIPSPESPLLIGGTVEDGVFILPGTTVEGRLTGTAIVTRTDLASSNQGTLYGAVSYTSLRPDGAVSLSVTSAQPLSVDLKPIFPNAPSDSAEWQLLSGQPNLPSGVSVSSSGTFNASVPLGLATGLYPVYVRVQSPSAEGLDMGPSQVIRVDLSVQGSSTVNLAFATTEAGNPLQKLQKHGPPPGHKGPAGGQRLCHGSSPAHP
jgi:hypothetical protein